MKDKDRDKNTKTEATVLVRTFGKFEVFYNGECISDKFSRAINQWELLKYLIAHDDSAVMPENAVDEL